MISLNKVEFTANENTHMEVRERDTIHYTLFILLIINYSNILSIVIYHNVSIFFSTYFADTKIGYQHRDNSYVHKPHSTLNTQHNPKEI